MKTQMTTQLMIECIQRQIELLNYSADLTHKQKRGALELMSLELDEVLLLHENEVSVNWEKFERYKNTLMHQLVKMEGLTMMCMAVLKHRAHNLPIQDHLVTLNELCRDSLREAREILRKNDDIPW